jgi:hypothetical protein
MSISNNTQKSKQKAPLPFRPTAEDQKKMRYIGKKRKLKGTTEIFRYSLNRTYNYLKQSEKRNPQIFQETQTIQSNGNA